MVNKLAALRNFMRELEADAAAYEADPRDGAAKASATAALLLQALAPERPELRRPFVALVVAFNDLDRGTKTKLFEPMPTHSRPGDPMDSWRKRAMAVVAQEKLVQVGVSASNARAMVAKVIRGLDEAGTAREVAARIVAWSRALREVSGRTAPRPAISLYRVMSEGVGEELALRAEAERQAFLLEQLKLSWSKTIGG